jgi:hypothetical protein
MNILISAIFELSLDDIDIFRIILFYFRSEDQFRVQEVKSKIILVKRDKIT